MRRGAAALLALVLCGHLAAQDAPQSPAPAGTSEALAQIEADRARANAAFDVEEAQCYKRFVVNSCLKDVQSRRTAMLRDLKHKETALHDAQRKQQGADALERIEQKAQDRVEKDAQAQQDAAQAQDRLQTQKDKQAQHAEQGQNAQPVASAARESHAPTPAQQAQNRQAYADKLEEAARKREAAAKRISEKTGKPLPPRGVASQAISPVAPASQPQ